MSMTGLHSPENQSQKERERETKKTRGPKLWWSKGALMIFLWEYIVCGTRNHKKYHFGNDGDQKTKHTATVTKGIRGNLSHKVRRQSISQERGARLSNFVKKRTLTKGDPSLPHTMTSVPGTSVLFCLKRDKGLMRDSTWASSHQTLLDKWPLPRSRCSDPPILYHGHWAIPTGYMLLECEPGWIRAQKILRSHQSVLHGLKS